MTTNPELEKSQNRELIAIARRGDLVMFTVLVGSAMAALAIGQHYDNLLLAIVAGGAILGVRTCGVRPRTRQDVGLGDPDRL